MHILNIPTAKEFIREVAFEENEPVMMWGPPGCGKSEAVQQVIAEMGGVLVDIRLSQYDSVDLRGIPSPDDSTMQTKWYSPETLPFENNPNFPSDKPIGLFLDEINSGSPPTLAVAYQLTNDKRVGEHKLRSNVRIICAGNREGDKGVTNRMPKPLANRLTHFEVEADVNASTVYFQQRGYPRECLGFLQYRKNLISTFDPNSADKAFATPRTWEKAFRYYAKPGMPAHIKQAAMAGVVGQGPSDEFWGFIELYSKVIPIPKIIADPKGVPLPDDMGMKYATTINVSGSMNPTNVAPLHTFIRRMPPEFVILCWSLAVKRDKALYGTDAFMDFSQTFKTLFT